MTLSISTFQDWAANWVEHCFGIQSSRTARRKKRVMRFFEEACELAQSFDMPKSHAELILHMVYERKPGDPKQEAGGVMCTLAALADDRALNLERCANVELKRIWRHAEAIREREKSKPQPDDEPWPKLQET